MADIDDSNEGLEPTPNDDEAARFETELMRQAAQLPPELYETMQPLLLLASVANHMLLGHPNDPVPLALREEMNYSMDDVQTVATAHDTPSLARVMAIFTLSLFDFVLVGRLVFESALDAPLRAYLARSGPPDDDFTGARTYFLEYSESLLENIGQYLVRQNEELREDIRMRRLQIESIFARLDDTLRPCYPPGLAPDELAAQALNAAEAAGEQAEAAVYISFNAVQRTTLGAALRLSAALAELGETPFARALASVRRLHRAALEPLANRLATAPPDEPFGLTRPELLRLYQAAQVCALSAVTDVLAAGSLEDLLATPPATGGATTPAEAAARAHQVREVLTQVMSGFVDAVEHNHPDDEEVAEAKAEISRLAELLLE